MALGVEFWVRSAVLLSFLMMLLLTNDSEGTPVEDDDVLYALSFWC